MIFNNINTLISSLRALEQSLEEEKFQFVVTTCVNSLKKGGKILFAGNGGSAADCQHIAAEFTGRFLEDRKPFAAIALTTDTSALTSISNDYGISQMFVRQLEALAKPNDVFIAISTSGNSLNIVECLKWCKINCLKSILFSGNDGGQAKNFADVSLIVPSTVTARIQECHILIGHSLIETIENKLIK